MRWPVFLVATVALHADTNVPHIRAAAEAFQAGQAARAKKQWDSAVNSFQKAIDIEPTFMPARRALILVDMEGGRRIDAAKAITQLLEIEPDETSERILLGQILLEQKQSERALAQFSTVLRAEPNNAEALLGFASAAAAVGMKDRAREALERGRKRYPSDPRFQVVPRQDK
jgi:tetratricopeptide (TPR) repeat protein